MKKSWKINAVYVAVFFAVSAVYFAFDEHIADDSRQNIVIKNEISENECFESTTVLKTTTVRAFRVTETAEITSASVTATTTAAEAVQLYIDINSADAETLAQLDGIGGVLAERIVEYRECYGDFVSIDELMNVDGIGSEKFEHIRDSVYVSCCVYNDENEDEIPVTETSAEETEHIPTLEEIAPIDLNTGGKEEFMLLPNVDEETAMRIISLREALGGYKNPYELLYIDELSQNEVAEILEFVTVGQ